MPSPSLNDVQLKIQSGDLRVALEAMQVWVKENRADLSDDIALLASSYFTAEREFFKGLIVHEEFSVRQQRVRQGILLMLDQVQQPDDEAAERQVLHDYHRHTCDRVEQNDLFNRLFGEDRQRRAQFYYLYGGDLQSHEGMFLRLAYELEGRLLDYLNPDLPAACRVEKIELTFDFSRQLDLYKENIVKSLFAALSVPVNEHEPLLEKNLLYIIDKSPKVQGLSAQDYVCVYLHISQYDWEARITPAAARWFIREFCLPELPEQSPSFLFFFAIEYDEADTTIISEVQTAVSQQEDIRPLPELTMVPLREIGRWLEKYKKIAPTTRERKELMEQHFGRVAEHYMEDVELALQRIIDEYNKRLIR